MSNYIKPERVMILAAGRGERLRPYTDSIPKPMLKVGDKPLIQYHVEALARAGFKQLVINHAYLGEQIEMYLHDGHNWGMEIAYSSEGIAPLETGGGIYKALPLLGDKPFLVVNADVWADYDYSDVKIREDMLAHLVLVPNPPHNKSGDFALQESMVSEEDGERHTFGGIGIYHPDLFGNCTPGRFPLAPLLYSQSRKGLVSGELHDGLWVDVGTPRRLQALDAAVKGGLMNKIKRA